jgi:hypothetical protein
MTRTALDEKVKKVVGFFICDDYLSSESEGPEKVPYPTGSESGSRTPFVNHICILEVLE